jgi:hypothetical protein
VPEVETDKAEALEFKHTDWMLVEGCAVMEAGGIIVTIREVLLEQPDVRSAAVV